MVMSVLLCRSGEGISRGFRGNERQSRNTAVVDLGGGLGRRTNRSGKEGAAKVEKREEERGGRCERGSRGNSL
jgi:hypothetical protein